MRLLGTIGVILCLATASGCNVCCWGKRASELSGPTDIRRSHYWCLGEDAVFEQPMGPSREDYGLKPTCWREWPADGARCTPGSCPGGTCPTGGCAPMLPPASQIYEPTPPATWEPSAPTEIGNRKGQGPNPFRDDPEPLPAPTTGQGSKINRPMGMPHANARPRAGAPLASKPVATPQRPLASVNRATAAQAPAATRRPILNTPTRPAALPLNGPKTTAAEPQPLKISVSPPTDMQVRYLAPIVAAPDVNTPAAQAVTLASLERMIDVSASDSQPSTGPAMVRNDFARQTTATGPATRKPPAVADDPQLEKKTLSALESMMSSDASPAARR